MPSQLINLLDEIKAAHENCRSTANEAIGHAIRCGELLTAAKEAVKANPATPRFGDWVEQYLPFSVRTAQSYMKLHNDLGQLPKAQRAALLKEAPSVSGVRKLLPDFRVPESPDVPFEPNVETEPLEDPDEPEEVVQEPQTGKGQAKVSAATLVDTMVKSHIGQVARGLTDIAEANGGEGEAFGQANDGLNQLISGLELMRKGER